MSDTMTRLDARLLYASTAEITLDEAVANAREALNGGCTSDLTVRILLDAITAYRDEVDGVTGGTR